MWQLNVPRESEDGPKSTSQMPNYFLERTDDASEDDAEERKDCVSSAKTLPRAQQVKPIRGNSLDS